MPEVQAHEQGPSCVRLARWETAAIGVEKRKKRSKLKLTTHLSP